jgi:predicted nucleic acid-binding protein
MSMIVIQELLVVADSATVKAYRKLVTELERRKLVVTPDNNDWFEVGKALSRIHSSGIADLGKLAKEHVNNLVKDALIARCAIRVGALVVTSNTTDFQNIKKVFPSLRFTSPSSYFGVRPR